MKEDSDSVSRQWWIKRRADIRAELSKDGPLRQTVSVHYGRSAIPGCYTIEAYHNDFPMPLAIIWYNLAGLKFVQINHIYTFDPVRRCGLMNMLREALMSGYPTRNLITGAGTKSGAAWMKATGWKKTDAGWELNAINCR